MHKTICVLLLALAAGLSFPLAAGQAGPVSQRDNSNRQFAAIDTSLVDAANFALDATATLQFQPEPLVRSPRPESPVAAGWVVDSAERISRRTAALRPLVNPILIKEGIPDQLAAVIQIESGGNQLALSPKGARGLWQLMPDTARRYGLRVDNQLDERLNPEKSTTTAARYLRDLYSEFGSWPLALAAYNTGELNLQRAIDRGHSRDFTILSTLGYLPAETREYVPAVIAAMGTLSPLALAPARDERRARFVYATFEQISR